MYICVFSRFLLFLRISNKYDNSNWVLALPSYVELFFRDSKLDAPALLEGGTLILMDLLHGELDVF